MSFRSSLTFFPPLHRRAIRGANCIQKGPNFLKTVQFRPIRAVGLPVKIIENPHRSRAKSVGSGRATAHDRRAKLHAWRQV